VGGIFMLKKIFALIKKLDDIILTLFTRMKVFYLILIIVSLMIIFLAIQGYMGLQIIDNMHAVTQKVFNTSMQDADNINSIKTALLNLRLNYLETVTKASYVTFDIDGILNQVRVLQSADKTVATQLEQELLGIKAFLDEPKSDTNYQELKKRFYLAQIYLQDLERAVKATTVNSMSLGNQFSTDSRRNTLAILICSTFISVGLGFLIAASISRPLQAIIKAANSLATGNLSQNIKAKGCLEAVSVVNGLNNAIIGLRSLVQGVNENAETLAKSCLELSDAANYSGKSATEVAKAMEQIAQASTEQTIQISDAVERVDLLAKLVTKVSGDAEKISIVSEQVAESAQLGQKATNNVVNEFNELFNFTKEAAQAINELHNTSEEISEIITVIRGIAEQTTLLALNAAIEAARAGEHGKGFGVVAVETGKLADQSKQAVGSISDLIAQMKTRTKHSVDVMQIGITKTEAGKKLAAEVTTTFEGIFQTLHENLQQIETVAKSARQMANTNDGVISAVTTIAAISEESMASTEEISATAEEQSASAEQVAALAENLNQVAVQMKQSVSLFEI
jgi:methyl-accepting chemotaxis protein